jgi:hypothetical protein
LKQSTNPVTKLPTNNVARKDLVNQIHLLFEFAVLNLVAIEKVMKKHDKCAKAAGGRAKGPFVRDYVSGNRIWLEPVTLANMLCGFRQDPPTMRQSAVRVQDGRPRVSHANLQMADDGDEERAG